MHAPPYIGRFAPTPSGYLHFGSLLAALASFLDARRHGGTWLVRMEDLDLARNLPGAADHILRTLEAYGMHWDGDVVLQSERTEIYRQALESLLDSGHAFRCDCSRKMVAAAGGIYPGTCRSRHLAASAEHAVRVRVADQGVGFIDRLQGSFSQNLSSDTGDFIVRRRDGVVAYQLAVVVDDIAQGVTDVVRGADLIDSTPRQIWLYRLLERSPPRYLHIPLIMRTDGEKLSKRLASAPIDPVQAPATLFRALVALEQQPPRELQGAPVSELLGWAIAHWQIERLPATTQLLESALPQP